MKVLPFGFAVAQRKVDGKISIKQKNIGAMDRGNRAISLNEITPASACEHAFWASTPRPFFV